VQKKGDPNENTFNLRGFSVGGTTGFRGIRVDGFRSDQNGYHFDRSLYERIDILKGTQAVKFGPAQPGGIVNYVTKKPRFESAYRVEGALGSFDLARSTIDATGPLDDNDTVAYRLVAAANNGDQTAMGDIEGDGFENDFYFVNPQLLWLTPGGGELSLSYEYNQSDRTFVPGIGFTGEEFLFDRKNVASTNVADREQHIGQFTFTQPIAERWEVSVGAKLTHGEADETFDMIFSPFDGRFTLRADEELDTQEYQVEVNGAFSTGDHIEHQMTLGANHFDYELDSLAARASSSETIDIFNPSFGPQPAIPPLEPNFTVT